MSSNRVEHLRPDRTPTPNPRMRILCDQMVKESFVSTLEAEDRHTVARVRDRLAPDAIVEWVV